MFSKIFKILLTLILISYTTVVYSSDGATNLLSTADSLFEQKQYTESLELYELLLQNGFYTPRALARLSLIYEGLGDYTYALHYLNLYYSKIPDKNILKKMDELASRYNLVGYEYNDLVFFISLYHRYYTAIILAFLAASVLSLFYFYIKYRNNKKLGFRPLLFMFILGLAYLLSNYDIVPQRAIIKRETILMSAPSAGATLLGDINKGHRVVINNKQDIWCEISWQNKIVFVREDNLLFTSNK